MSPSAHFQHLPAVICRRLDEARSRIQIAVCWFSHRDIFDVLLKKQRNGVVIDLLLEYDSQNIRAQGLDFSIFIKLGGNLYAYRDSALMHHKFALIDEGLLLTGSFNWTYNSNAENLIATDAPELVLAFREEFNRLKACCVQIRKINPAAVKVFANYPLFQNTHFQLSDLRKRISGGAVVWWVRLGREPGNWAGHFKAHRLPIDAKGLLRSYWTAWRRWDPEFFDDWWRPEGAAQVKAANGRALRTLIRRMQVGDLVLAIVERQQLVGLGIIQSEPKPADTPGFSTYREVQWLRVVPDAPLFLPKPMPYGQAGRFRGSALQLVQELFS